VTIAERVANRTQDAYSVDRYRSWLACAKLLHGRGYTEREIETIMRSKIMRWAADWSSKPHGRATAADLASYLDREPLRQETLDRWVIATLGEEDTP
jgi:hypothetical protein